MHGWWHRVISTMQGLNLLYNFIGRKVEWTWLVNKIVPDFIDLANDGPFPGREDDWSLITWYRIG